MIVVYVKVLAEEVKGSNIDSRLHKCFILIVNQECLGLLHRLRHVYHCPLFVKNPNVLDHWWEHNLGLHLICVVISGSFRREERDFKIVMPKHGEVLVCRTLLQSESINV